MAEAGRLVRQERGLVMAMPNLQFILDPDTGEFVPNPDYAPPVQAAAAQPPRPRGFQMPGGAPATAIADTVAQAFAQQAQPRPMPMPDIPGVTNAMPPPGGTQGFQMPPAAPRQMTDTPSFMERMLQSIYDSGGIKTALGNNPRGGDAFIQNLLAGGFNAAATGANRKREELSASNEALKAQNLKDREATRLAQKTSDDRMYERLTKKQDLTEAEKRWLEQKKVEHGYRMDEIREAGKYRATGGAGGEGGADPVDAYMAEAEAYVNGQLPITNLEKQRQTQGFHLLMKAILRVDPKFDMRTALMDQRAIDGWYKSLNSNQSVAMRRSAIAATGTLDLISEQIDKVERMVGSTNINKLNSLTRGAMRNFGVGGPEVQKELQLLNNLISDVTLEMPNVMSGGYAPTDAQLKKAASTFSGDWNWKVLKASTDLAKRMMQIRYNSIMQSGAPSVSNPLQFGVPQTEFKVGDTGPIQMGGGSLNPQFIYDPATGGLVPAAGGH